MFLTYSGFSSEPEIKFLEQSQQHAVLALRATARAALCSVSPEELRMPQMTIRCPYETDPSWNFYCQG
jgi:hypothetical protein